MTRIFISHSHSDEAIAFKLVNFLLATLRIEEEEILCTSNPDQGLSYSSSSITEQLKNQLKNSDVLIILITTDSLHSAWIPFEAGSFWTTDKPIIPILGPGLNQNDLPGPLRSQLSIPIKAQDFEAKLNGAINQLVNKLKIEQKLTTRRNHALKEFSQHLRDWKSQLPDPNLSQQKQIESQQQQIVELTSKLEEIKTDSQQEKQQIIKSYQTQIQELKQSNQNQRQSASLHLHFIWICDCSGSMSVDDKIQTLNNAIKNTLPEMQLVADENLNTNVLIRAVKFSSGAQWHVATPTPVDSFTWTDLTADGQTDMGKALTLVAEQLKMPPMTDRALPPVLILLSDGHPTDDFGSGLKALLREPWGKRAVKIAIAIGRDADKSVLQKFMDQPVGHPEARQPLEANNPESLVSYIEWASTAVLKAASSPTSQAENAFAGNINVPIEYPASKSSSTEDLW